MLLNTSGGELFSSLLENIISLVLPALKVTFQSLAQEEIFSRSLFNTWAVLFGSCPLASKEQSSANIKISLSYPCKADLYVNLVRQFLPLEVYFLKL